MKLLTVWPIDNDYQDIWFRRYFLLFGYLIEIGSLLIKLFIHARRFIRLSTEARRMGLKDYKVLQIPFYYNPFTSIYMRKKTENNLYSYMLLLFK